MRLDIFHHVNLMSHTLDVRPIHLVPELDNALFSVGKPLRVVHYSAIGGTFAQFISHHVFFVQLIIPAAPGNERGD